MYCLITFSADTPKIKPHHPKWVEECRKFENIVHTTLHLFKNKSHAWIINKMDNPHTDNQKFIVSAFPQTSEWSLH
jgi:hypothetical protein